MRVFAAGIILISALAVLPAAANPLYVGSEEVDTTNIEVVRNLVAHCQRITNSSDNAGIEMAVPQSGMEAMSSWPGTSATELEPSSIAVEHLIMPNTGPSEGEDGDDASISEVDEEKGEAVAVDFSAIERHDCKSAGILH